MTEIELKIIEAIRLIVESAKGADVTYDVKNYVRKPLLKSQGNAVKETMININISAKI